LRAGCTAGLHPDQIEADRITAVIWIQLFVIGLLECGSNFVRHLVR
jgi:hypothetical protein